MKDELPVPEVKELKSFLYGVPHTQIDQWWDQVEPLIAKALWRTGAIKDFSTEDVLELIKARDMQCWLAHDGAEVLAVGITQVLLYPQRDVLGIPFVGAKRGSMPVWLSHLETLKEYAKAQGCSVIRGWGRKGWEEIIKPDVVRIEFDIEV